MKLKLSDFTFNKKLPKTLFYRKFYTLLEGEEIHKNLEESFNLIKNVNLEFPSKKKIKYIIDYYSEENIDLDNNHLKTASHKQILFLIFLIYPKIKNKDIEQIPIYRI